MTPRRTQDRRAAEAVGIGGLRCPEKGIHMKNKIGLRTIVFAALISIPVLTQAQATEDAVLETIQTEVNVAKSKADKNAADIESMKGGVPDLERRVGLLETTGGTPGADGVDGAQGPEGPQGPAGADGADGVDGAPGADGLPGADGPAGPQGEQGPQGVAGNLALAGQSCSAGSFVTGFNNLGEIICDTIEPGPGEPPVPLPSVAGQFAVSINGLIGNELGLPEPISAVAAGAAVSWSPTLSGFALCLPSNLDAPPVAAPPIYGCLANVTVNVLAAADGTSIEITASVADFFYDFAGDWTLIYITNESGSGAGYVLLSDMVVTVNASLIDVGGGFWQIGPTNWTTFSYGSDSYEVEFGNVLLDTYSFVVGDSLAANIIGEVEKIVVDTIEQQALSVPSFLIE